MAVLAKATHAIDLIARAGGPVRLADAATMLAMPKSSAHRLLNELVDHDLLRRDEDGRFQLGVRLLSWGLATELSFDIRGIAYPYLQALSEETGETVNLHVIQADHRVCVASIRGRDPLTPALPIGQTLPLGIGATGKVLLAFAPTASHARVRAMLEDSGRTCPSDAELSSIRAIHWATAHNEQELGLAAGATVILGNSGRAVAAIAVGGLTSRLTHARLEDLRPLVLTAARSITSQLVGVSN